MKVKIYIYIMKVTIQKEINEERIIYYWKSEKIR